MYYHALACIWYYYSTRVPSDTATPKIVQIKPFEILKLTADAFLDVYAVTIAPGNIH